MGTIRSWVAAAAVFGLSRVATASGQVLTFANSHDYGQHKPRRFKRSQRRARR